MQSLSRAYKSANVPLWVTPAETFCLMRSRNFHPSVAAELSDWMARRMSMAFAAGFMQKPAPITVEKDIVRQLQKMGYCEQNARELAGMVNDNIDGLYRKGQERGLLN